MLKLDQVTLITKVTKQTILDNICLEVNQGDRLGLVGASGAGKTSLFRVINRLQNITSGALYFNNYNYQEIPVIDLRQKIVYLPQEPKLLNLTVAETLIYPLLLQKLPETEIRQRQEYWREQLKISQELLERKESQLSLGQRQLITLARALMMEPKILLLDEPNSALDQAKTDNLLTILHNLSQEQKMTILLISHHLNFLEDFAQKVIYLDQGKIVENQPIAKIDWQQIQARLKLNNEEQFEF